MSRTTRVTSTRPASSSRCPLSTAGSLSGAGSGPGSTASSTSSASEASYSISVRAAEGSF
ncbi:hypothetical protein DMH12_02800 [Streptomyces sp. WAC 04229]|nr:hypothetical protein DMH12_02800 [Streptomyces sp. WAC 04229]